MHTLTWMLFALTFLAGCRQQDRKVIGVVPKGANHIFWQTVHAGAIKAAQEYGFAVEWNAPTLEIDSSRQIAIVESMVNRRLAGIALAPVDRQALVNVVERAADAMMPIAVFDSDIDTQKRLTYVATDNREGGRMAARHLAEAIGGKGKVALVGFMPGSASTMEREDGFQEELREKFPNIEMVQLVFGMADRAKARAATENILSAHPDLRGIFADNESSSAGAALAIRARNAPVKMVAFDANEQLIGDLHDGRIEGIVLQNPFEMGYQSVKAIGMKLNGKSPPDHIDSGVVLATRDNMLDRGIAPLLRPDISRWLAADGH